MMLSLSFSLSALCVSGVLYLIAVAIYRVFFSPLAKFPGPKLAALTTWYQAYFDIWLGGQFFKEIDRLHEEYGRIVRINPYEIHINDPYFIDDLYTGSAKKRDKFKWSGRQTLRTASPIAILIEKSLTYEVPDSLVATVPHDQHRKRRAAMNPFFSKASIRKLDPAIQNGLAIILKRLKSCATSSDIFHASIAYKAATCDIITEFSFGVSTDYAAKDDYEESYFKAVDDHLHLSWMLAYIAWFGPLMMSIPLAVMSRLYPGLIHLWNMHSHWVKQIDNIRSQDKSGDGTIFHGILNSDLVPPEKSNQRLRQEAQLLVLAGQDTTAYTLSSLTYEILAKPTILKKLKEELQGAIPDPDMPLTSAQLEQLPYLTAIIQEGIRIHPGALVRQTRIATEQTLVYKDTDNSQEWVIPSGVPVSMDARSCNFDARMFSNPHEFIPERWIDNPRLDKYMLSFSRGTRICLGMNLAYAELYILLAGVFRRYDIFDGTGKQNVPTLALYDVVKERDVDVKYDYQVPFPEKESEGIRVKVRPSAEV